MYPNMQTRALNVDGKEVLTDGEGYIVYLDHWSESFVHAQAAAEGLTSTDEHWQVVNYLRDYWHEHGVQCEAPKIVKYFKKTWGAEKGSSSYLHGIFPRGRPAEAGKSAGWPDANKRRTLTFAY